MKRSINAILPVAIFTLLYIFLPACRKAYDYLQHHPDAELKCCQIQQLTRTNNGETLVNTFSYNSAGNPIAILSSAPRLNYAEEFHFRYDSHNRLSDFYDNLYGNTGSFVWHRYSYPNPSTVVDSVFDYVGNINDPEPPHSSFDTYVYRLDLDGQGRIIRRTDLTGAAGGEIVNFNYDVRGNLVRTGVPYDDKVNIFRTNKVWMFIYQDYSLNNPLAGLFYPTVVQITGYNSYGLPLHFNDDDGNYLFGNSYTTLDVQYSCDPGKLPKDY